MNLYNLHNNSKTLYKYDEAIIKIPEIFMQLYRMDEDKLKELEDAIATSPKYSFMYANDYLEGRFRKGESAILTSPQLSFYYTRNFIKDRWLEAEDVIRGTYYEDEYNELMHSIGINITI